MSDEQTGHDHTAKTRLSSDTERPVKAHYALATLGSQTDRGGIVVSVTTDVLANGHRLARVGDKVFDPIDGETEIVSGAGYACMYDGVPVAIVGSKTSNGATIVSSLQNEGFIVEYEDEEPIPGFLQPGYRLDKGENHV